MPPRTHYNILPAAGIDDISEWELHCQAVNAFINYTAKGLAAEYTETDNINVEEAGKYGIKFALQWAKQLNLIEVVE